MVILLLGCTVSTLGGLKQGIERAAALEYQCTQVYITKSRSWDIGSINIDNLEEYAKSFHVHLIGHIPLIVNIASKKDTIRKKSMHRLKQEVLRADQCGVRVLVLHPGSTLDGDTARGLACVAEAMDELSDLCTEHDVTFALETMSGQGTQLGSHFEELAHILHSVKDNSHIAVCLDTCHMYAAGYRIDSLESLSDVLTQFDELIGLDRIQAIHLNNTKVERGHKTDRHSSVFNGNIPLEVFESLVCDERLAHVPMVLEPPAKDLTGPQQVRYLSEIRARRLLV